MNMKKNVSTMAKIVTFRREINPFSFEWLLYKNDKAFVKKLLDYLDENTSVLDVGCGTAGYWNYRDDIKWEGLDIDPNSRAKYIVQPGDSFPISINSFDGVLLSYSLEHIENIQHTAIEIKKVLKSGGVLILRSPFIYPLHDTPEDFWRFSSEGIKRLFSDYDLLYINENGNYFSAMATFTNYFIIQSQKFIGDKISKILSALLAPLFLLFILFMNISCFLLSRLDKTKKFPVLIDVVLRKK